MQRLLKVGETITVIVQLAIYRGWEDMIHAPKPRPVQRPRPAPTRMMARVVRAAPACLALTSILPQICHGGRAELGERMYRSAGIGWRRIGFTEPQYKLVAASSPRQKKTM
jgi:hypothetical protein